MLKMTHIVPPYIFRKISVHTLMFFVMIFLSRTLIQHSNNSPLPKQYEFSNTLHCETQQHKRLLGKHCSFKLINQTAKCQNWRISFYVQTILVINVTSEIFSATFSQHNVFVSLRLHVYLRVMMKATTVANTNNKGVLSQGNSAMPQRLFRLKFADNIHYKSE